MSRIQQWVAGTVVAIIAIVAAGWFLAIAPQKQKVKSLASQAASQEQENSKLRTNLAVLTSQMQAVPSEQAAVAAVGQRIPTNPDMPSYIRALTAAAQQTGVELVSISPGAPVAVAVPVAAVPASTAQDGVSASSAPSHAAAPNAGAAPAPAAASLQTISVNLSVQGGYFQIQQFVAALQKLTRSTVVSSLALAPGTALKSPALATGAVASTATAWKSLQATVAVSVFMNSSDTFTVPVAPAQVAGAPIPSAAAASPSPSASASN
jgi:Tfp pilus assembly protein PilO